MPTFRALPVVAGIGLRAPHVAEIRRSRPSIGWLEVHSENYFVDGGPALAALEAIRVDYPISLHGVGLSLGSADPLDADHLARLKRLADRIEPAAISEHLSWSHVDGVHLNDLLPLPLTEEALALICDRIDAVQSTLGRPLLVENVSSYLRFADDAMPEWDFVAAVSAKSGCRLLFDINNVYVNAVNYGFDPQDYVAAIAAESVAEIHLAGFDADGPCLIDTHDARVSPPVWTLYRGAIERFGPKPTLLEWDSDIPALEVLLDEAAKAQAILDEHRDAVAA
ncbi:MAG: MNIO family bufferin maturase [Casimicrobiaceae bacterium]